MSMMHVAKRMKLLIEQVRILSQSDRMMKKLDELENLVDSEVKKEKMNRG